MTLLWPLRFAKALSDDAITLVISNIANTDRKMLMVFVFLDMFIMVIIFIILYYI